MTSGLNIIIICQGELICKFIHRLSSSSLLVGTVPAEKDPMTREWQMFVEVEFENINWQSLWRLISYNLGKYPRPGTDFNLSPESCLDVDPFPPTPTAEDFEELLGS